MIAQFATGKLFLFWNRDLCSVLYRIWNKLRLTPVPRHGIIVPVIPILNDECSSTIRIHCYFFRTYGRRRKTFIGFYRRRNRSARKCGKYLFFYKCIRRFLTFRNPIFIQYLRIFLIMSDCIIYLHAFPFCVQCDVMCRHCIVKLLFIICIQIPAKESAGFSFRCCGQKFLSRPCGKCRFTFCRQSSIRCLQVIGYCILSQIIENMQFQTSVSLDLTVWQCIVSQLINSRIISTRRSCNGLPCLSGQILYLM